MICHGVGARNEELYTRPRAFLYDGRVLVAFNPASPGRRFGDDPHVLDRMMEGLRFEVVGPEVQEDFVDVDESIGSALALIGRVTGTDMAADWIEVSHSRIRGTSS
ncbi:DUF6461 domain-containing protein [Sphaerisporangium dianthi]|uniref:DUF6461 domain-containing protein n=1 Tax=Sphaerisporangium dianthi TaxID=1436120 RepID=A0ABV9CJX4_9ACTN